MRGGVGDYQEGKEEERRDDCDKRGSGEREPLIGMESSDRPKGRGGERGIQFYFHSG